LEITKTQEFLYLSKPGIWFIDYLMKHFPASMVTNFLKTESTLNKAEVKQRMKEIIDDEDKLAFLKLMMATMTQRYDERKPGLAIDIKIDGREAVTFLKHIKECVEQPERLLLKV
jgi:hypothetical protein